MYSVRLTIAAVSLLVTCLRVAQCDFLPQGLCRPDAVNILRIDYEKVLNMSCWNVMYVVQTKIFHNMDHATLRFTPNGDGTYTMDATRVMDDSTSDTNTFYNWYDYDAGIIRNKYVNHETGKVHYFEDYPLAMTPNNAALYIRCSYEGGVPVDTRYISIPTTNTLTEQDVQMLLAVDKKYHLRGNLMRLPYRLPRDSCP